MLSVRPLRSTGIYPASSLVWASPTPFRAAPPVMYSRRALVALAPSLSGLPGSSTDLSTRAAPNHPGKPGGCLPVASPPVSGFILVGRLATFVFLTRPNRVHLRCGPGVRPCQVFARSISPSRACWATCPNKQFTLNSFQFTRSARLILAHRPSGSGPGVRTRLFGGKPLGFVVILLFRYGGGTDILHFLRAT